MGKVVLEFDSAEEQDEIKSALEGYKWKLAMWDLNQHLRSVVKYEIGNPTEEQIDFAEKLREEIKDILNGYKLNIEN